MEIKGVSTEESREEEEKVTGGISLCYSFFHVRICNEPLCFYLFQDYSFSSVRVETPLLLVVNGKPQGSSSQAAATVASRPQCE